MRSATLLPSARFGTQGRPSKVLSRWMWPSTSGGSTTTDGSRSCGGTFDLDGKRTALTALEAEMADPAFWGNQERARDVVQRVKDLKGWVEPFERLEGRIRSAIEMDALLEYDSFALVETSLKSVSCKQVSADDNSAQVVCQGSIEASYNGEMQSFDLSARTYTVQNDNGNWLVCGYKK